MDNFISYIINFIASFTQNVVQNLIFALVQQGFIHADTYNVIYSVLGMLYYVGYALAGLVVIVFHIIISKKLSDAAKEKGHADKKPIVGCILFGLPGYIYVASLPDLKARPAVANTEEALPEKAADDNEK